LFEEQLARLSALERAVLRWLAVAREPVALGTLAAALGRGGGRAGVLEAVEALRRRSLGERGEPGARLTLPSVGLEHATDRRVEEVAAETGAEAPERLERQPLVQATAQDHVRQSQERLIARPLLAPLDDGGGAAAAERRLEALLAGWRGRPAAAQGYGPGNAVNLLRLRRGELRGVDLSRLALRQAYLA